MRGQGNVLWTLSYLCIIGHSYWMLQEMCLGSGQENALQALASVLCVIGPPILEGERGCMAKKYIIGLHYRTEESRINGL